MATTTAVSEWVGRMPRLSSHASRGVRCLCPSVCLASPGAMESTFTRWIADPDTVSWLTALVWADDADREVRLREAVDLAIEYPPPVTAGELLEGTARLAARAPAGTELVVFHSAVMPYLEPTERSWFIEIVSGLRATWISFEPYGVLPVIDARLPDVTGSVEGLFVLSRDEEPVALADPHGRWARWLA
jgi:hypothetical protein